MLLGGGVRLSLGGLVLKDAFGRRLDGTFCRFRSWVEAARAGRGDLLDVVETRRIESDSWD